MSKRSRRSAQCSVRPWRIQGRRSMPWRVGLGCLTTTWCGLWPGTASYCKGKAIC